MVSHARWRSYRAIVSYRSPAGTIFGCRNRGSVSHETYTTRRSQPRPTRLPSRRALHEGCLAQGASLTRTPSDARSRIARKHPFMGHQNLMCQPHVRHTGPAPPRRSSPSLLPPGRFFTEDHQRQGETTTSRKPGDKLLHASFYAGLILIV